MVRGAVHPGVGVTGFPALDFPSRGVGRRNMNGFSTSRFHSSYITLSS